MSIDVASLVFEIDSTQAVTARERLEGLEAAGAKVDASARRVKTATEMAGIGLEKTAAGSRSAAKAATEHAQAQGVVEKATLQAERAATRAAEKEAAAWSRVEAALVKRNAAYRGDLAVAALKAEAAATLQLDRALASAVQGHDLLFRTHGRAIGSSKAMTQATLNLSRQFADVGVTAAMGMNPLMILIQQGPQIADAFQMAKTQGLGFSQVLKGMAASLGLIHVTVPPVIAEAAALAAAEQAAALAAVEVAIANRAAATSAVATATANQALATTAAEAAAAEVALATATAGQAAANRAATVAAGQLAAANEVVATTATAAAAAEAVALAPLAAILAGLAAAAALTAGAFAVGAQKINEGNKDILSGLNLTDEQLKKITHTSVTMGDTIKATFQVAGEAIWDAFGPQIEQVGKAIKSWYDELIANTVLEIKAIVGLFVGGYEAIKATWGLLPAAMGDAVATAANFVLGGIEKMVNGAIDLLNKLSPALNTLAAMTGVDGRLGQLDHIKLNLVANSNEGAMRNAGEVAAKAYADGFAKGGAAVDGTFSKIAAQAVKNAQAAARKQAGDDKATKTPKGAAAPRDQTDERTAQIEGMIQAALADELQARLGVTREIEARADIERQIAHAQEAVKAAQIAGRQATLDEDLQRKRINQATYDELSGQLKIVASINARAAAYREQAIEEAKIAARSREVFGLRQAQAEVQLRELASQEAIAKFDHERYGLARDRLKIEQTLEREALEQVTAANGATEYQIKIAQSLLNRLGAIQANEREAFRMHALDRAVGETTRAVQDIGDALREHDWGRVFTSLIKVADQAIVAFANAKTSAERMSASGSLISVVGGAVGGKAGSAIGAIGSGFSAAGAAAGMAGSFGAIGGAIAGLAGPIGIAVAGFSLLSGILGDQKAKKRAKLEQEARDMENARAAALEEANRQAELQLRILELSGDEIGALTKRREAELATLKGASRALAEYVHALEDWVKAVDLAKDAVSKAEDDLRAAYEAEKDRLNAIMAGVVTARDRLRDAYQRERSAIEGTISSVRSLVETFADFRKELDMMAVANDPSRQYGYTQRQFASATNDNFVERGRAFAEASQSASATELDFQRDLAAVRRRTDEAAKTAQTQLTAAEKQLLALDNLMSPLLGANDNLLTIDEAIRGLLTAEQEAALAAEELVRLDAQVGALITINSSVLSVAQAVNNLQGALGVLAAAQASKPAEGAAGAGRQVVGPAAYVDMNPDLAALYASGSGMAAGRTKEQLGAYHWERYGQGEQRTYAAFAAGGDHTGGLRLVGEEGPELEATGPSRIFSARQTAQMLGGDNSEVVAELRSLREEVASLRKEAAKTAGNTKSMDARGKRQEFNGAYVRGQTPDDPVVVVAA